MKRRDFLVAAAVAPLAPAAVAATQREYKWTEVGVRGGGGKPLGFYADVKTAGAHPRVLWDGIQQWFPKE